MTLFGLHVYCMHECKKYDDEQAIWLLLVALGNFCTIYRNHWNIIEVLIASTTQVENRKQPILINIPKILCFTSIIQQVCILTFPYTSDSNSITHGDQAAWHKYLQICTHACISYMYVVLFTLGCGERAIFCVNISIVF